MIQPLLQSSPPSSPRVRRLKGFSKAGLVLPRAQSPSCCTVSVVDMRTMKTPLLRSSSSASTTTAQPKKTVKQLIIAMLREDGGTNALNLKDCMIRSEYTRQWINQHIKNNTSIAKTTHGDDSFIYLSSKAAATITPSTVKNCHSGCLSSSKRFFRLAKTKKMSEKDLRLAAASKKQGLLATSLLKPPRTKSLARETSGTKHFLASSGVLPPSNSGSRKIAVSDFLRRARRT